MDGHYYMRTAGIPQNCPRKQGHTITFVTHNNKKVIGRTNRGEEGKKSKKKNKETRMTKRKGKSGGQITKKEK